MPNDSNDRAVSQPKSPEQLTLDHEFHRRDEIEDLINASPLQRRQKAFLHLMHKAATQNMPDLHGRHFNGCLWLVADQPAMVPHLDKQPRTIREITLSLEDAQRDLSGNPILFQRLKDVHDGKAVSYTHLTLPTIYSV